MVQTLNIYTTVPSNIFVKSVSNILVGVQQKAVLLLLLKKKKGKQNNKYGTEFIRHKTVTFVNGVTCVNGANSNHSVTSIRGKMVIRKREGRPSHVFLLTSS
uniref:Uncharacterized protein n=1 Tax=Trypanosoma vivax (strain Y486) TaxID=1055687 RepID=G0TTG6_TRYVY|nr:hypothetical protein, unlikely [Trypanosoma vivax Y486]